MHDKRARRKCDEVSRGIVRMNPLAGMILRDNELQAQRRYWRDDCEVMREMHTVRANELIKIKPKQLRCLSSQCLFIDGAAQTCEIEQRHPAGGSGQLNGKVTLVGHARLCHLRVRC